MTNISFQTIKFQSLVQIPEGALPLNNSHFQKSHNQSLGAFSTLQFLFYFYFPHVGSFNHFPTNVSINRIVVAKAKPNVLKVKRSQSTVNEDDFDDVLATENVVSILNFMKNKNIRDSNTNGFNFKKIYWLCKDKTFFTEGVKILREKNIFDSTFWSYSTIHQDEESIREYLSVPASQLKNKVGS